MTRSDVKWTIFVILAVAYVIFASYQLATWQPHEEHIEHNPPEVIK